MGVTKMGNIVPRAGIGPTSLAFRASVLPLCHIGFPDVTAIRTPTCLMLLASEVSADYYSIHCQQGMVNSRQPSLLLTGVYSPRFIYI